MVTKAQGNVYKDTRVCIDSYHDRSYAGTITNPWYGGSIPFAGTMDFLDKMQDVVEDMRFPAPERVLRGFTAEKPEPVLAPLPSGSLASFSVVILFCRNASWQGILKWKEGGREAPFRSALELLFLMDSACREAAQECPAV